MIWWNGVGKDRLNLIWEIVLPDFEKLIQKRIYTPDRIKTGLDQGEFQLWIFGEQERILISLLTEIRGDTIIIHLFAGRESKKVFESGQFNILGDWAKRIGARRIIARPRPAMAKYGIDYWGFKKIEDADDFDGTGKHVYELDLTDWPHLIRNPKS